MMERALKERIVGAAILVLFAVLVVPIFLDGPPGQTETITERVLLPGQDADKTQTVVLERNRTEPVPSGAEPTTEIEKPATPVKRPNADKVAVAPPAVEEQSTATPAKSTPAPAEARVVSSPASASATGMWAVQLGSFSNKSNAEMLAADLRKQGYAAFLSQLATNSGSLHRVRIGPQKDRQGAEAVAARLKNAGHTGQVVPHP
jgi:DedD protein